MELARKGNGGHAIRDNIISGRLNACSTRVPKLRRGVNNGHAFYIGVAGVHGGAAAEERSKVKVKLSFGDL